MENNKNMEEMKTSVSEINGLLGLMERMKRFINKEGIKGTVTSLLTLFIAVSVGYFIINPGSFFERFERFSTEKHEEAIKARMEADPQIREYLADMKAELLADRTYVLEAHNGGSNLSNLPFLYTDLTYMVPRGSFGELEEEYKNFRLSRFPWASYVVDNSFWFGPIQDTFENDPELFYKLQKEGVTHMGMMLLHGNNTLPSGCLGVVYVEGQNIPSELTVMKIMQKYSNIISPLLNNDNNDKTRKK